MPFVLDIENSIMSKKLLSKLIDNGFSKVDVNVRHFKDGETFVDFEQCVRGNDVFIISSIAKPVNENLMKVAITADAVRRASAKSIILICPYLGYSRQDRKVKPHQPITAKLVADILQSSGISRLVTVDLHSMQIQGFYNIPTDNISMVEIAGKYFKKLDKKYLVISPDHGGVSRARKFADILSSDIAIIDKNRQKPNEIESMNIIGNVKNRDCLIVDDLVDTGNTLIMASKELKKHGAKSVTVYCTHGVLSDDAVENLLKSTIDEIYVSDTISSVYETPFKIISCVPILKIFADVINSNKSMEIAKKEFLED